MDTSVGNPKKLKFKTLFYIYLRSYFFQGSFSVKDRQNLGFAYCMEPAGKKLWEKPADRKTFLLRHTEYYNGNPFMVPLVLGAVINMEENLSNGGSVTPEDITRFKTATGQASGAIGDHIFWRTLRPFGLVVGLLCSLTFGLWGVLMFLAIFNIPTSLLKLYWLLTGYRLGPKVGIAMKNRSLDRIVKLMEKAGGSVISFFVLAFLSGYGYGLSWITFGTVLIFVVSTVLYSRLIPHSIVVACSIGIAIIFTTLVS